jgi:quercetin dioxygenase-like cupin family protein
MNPGKHPHARKPTILQDEFTRFLQRVCIASETSEPRKNEEVEIKYWEFKAGEEVGHGTKVSAIIECTFILKGRTRCLVGDDEIELKQGDYIVIKPGTPNNTVVEIIEDVVGLTIKAPSDPTAKKLV